MATITYTGRDTASDGMVRWHGLEFEPGQGVETDNADLIEAARGNPFFDVIEGGKSTDEDGTEDESVGDYVVKHRGRGRYAVLKGDEVIADGLTRDEAEAHAADHKAADEAAETVRREAQP